MGMTKHGNTFFPEDKVRPTSPEGIKVAGNKNLIGSVTGADPDSGKVKVAWPGGREEWHAPEDLKKV